ncbi:MAG: hypothetical protein A3G81_31875 [Betaproteobacteria bacterium RIFCSPLOWO2_12_FULL_65_14]|nr:MAG: hypothetical protein A3G81_31875 [Betaproteobacteria bacterium RIFCSPLOWO2_12_FULL_65_14]
MKKAAQELFQLARTALERAGAHGKMAQAAARGGACLIDNRDGLPYVSVEWAVGEVIQRARRPSSRGATRIPSWSIWRSPRS